MISVVEFVGLFSYHKVVYGGRAVPCLQAHPLPDGRVELVLDHRFSLTLEADQIQQVTAFLADAIAIALGYSCHPREGDDPIVKSHPFGGRMVGITINPPALSVVPAEDGNTTHATPAPETK